MHASGITIGNEPGGILAKPVQDGINTVFSSPDMPFRWSLMPDAKTLVSNYPDEAQVIAETEKLESWYGGMTSLAPKQAKLFADGAIYSLLMQVREPYLDGHTGEWMMDKDVFERAFRIYWDAGYQIHVHVNGDAGLDRVLDTLEANLRRNPRYDHRTVLVYFAVSAEEQVQRISDLDDSPLAVEPMKIRDIAVWGGHLRQKTRRNRPHGCGACSRRAGDFFWPERL